jgi:hypothetical protein
MTDKEALRMALEALTPMQNSRDDTAIERAITSIKQALAAPVQEPVAWRWTNSKGWLTYGELPHDRFESTPLYTTPPAAQRQWVGLTEEELQKILQEVSGQGWKPMLEAIEAKLKENNI